MTYPTPPCPALPASQGTNLVPLQFMTTTLTVLDPPISILLTIDDDNDIDYSFAFHGGSHSHTHVSRLCLAGAHDARDHLEQWLARRLGNGPRQSNRDGGGVD